MNNAVRSTRKPFPVFAPEDNTRDAQASAIASSASRPAQPAADFPTPIDPLREQLSIAGPMLMYVGNLESYQGIDLLLDSFAQILPAEPTAHLVIIGGKEDDIEKYQVKAHQQGIDGNVHLVGPRPIAHLKSYLEQADIVVSPRTQGDNTPMKLYSYLDCGRALLATNLLTHTQVLNEQIAQLASPEVNDFASGMLKLIQQPDLRDRLAIAAQAYIAKEHTYDVFSQKLSGLYDWLSTEIEAAS